jgi:hypothetical protein
MVSAPDRHHRSVAPLRFDAALGTVTTAQRVYKRIRSREADGAARTSVEPLVDARKSLDENNPLR